MAFRWYGRLAWRAVERDWEISNLEPHVAIRLKHLFPRIPKQSTGCFHLPGDDLTAADLDWFLSRYPLQMLDDDAARLRSGRRSFERVQAEMERILLPDYVPTASSGSRICPGQELRQYQWQAVELLRRRKRLLVGDEGGLGKTYLAAGFLATEPAALPAAVVCDPHLQIQWQDKVESFTDLRVHRIRKASPYNLPPADLYVFRVTQILGWADIFAQDYFRSVVFDEPQSLRRGTDTSKGRAARVLSEHVRYSLGLTATPIYNYGTEMWNVLSFIDDAVLGSYADFSREWVNHAGRIADPKALGTYLREQHALLRRLKSDVGQQLPKVSRIIETVEHDDKAVRSIEELAQQLALRATSGSFVERGQAVRDLDILVRQATGVAKARSVAQWVRLLVEAGEPVLLVGWHRDVYDIWLRELADLQPAMYTGSESAAQKDREKQRFLQGETPVLILSLRSGAGLDGLQEHCSNVVFGELDWSPGIHQQVIWRLDREGQTQPVTAFFLVSNEGSDPPIMEVLGIKASEAHQIVDPLLGIQTAASGENHLQKLVQRYLAKRAPKQSAPAADSLALLS